MMHPKTMTAYLLVEGFEHLAEKSLTHIIERYDRLILTAAKPQNNYWCDNIWLNPEFVQFASIKDAATKLKAIQPHWMHYPYKSHRRATLIQDALPKIRTKLLDFPHVFPKTLPPLGSFTLLDDNNMLISSACSSPYPNGKLEFNEDRINPPSRAYLKLYEAFTRAQKWPKPGEQCIELGASPGGWTWVIVKLGAQVIAVDRAPLIPSLMQSNLVEFKQADAFKINPKDFTHIDWLFSDLACYPEKLYDYVQEWLDTDKCKNFICTLKFQGDSHYEIIDKFAAIPDSQIIHLNCNKHELTWMRLT